MSDILTGTHMASAVMAGLLKAARTGRGSVVGTSQTQALMWMQLQAVGVVANLGTKFERFDPFSTSNPLFTVYETADGWIAVAALQPHQWPAIARAVGLGDMLSDERFADAAAVHRNRDEFRERFADHMRSNTTDHWFAALRGCGAWVAPVNRLEDLATDENILANEYLVTFDDGFIGPPAPFEVDGFRGTRGPVADYGEHTDEVLSELGFDDDSITQLRVDGAVW